MEDEGEADGESIQERNRSNILPGELAIWEERAELGDSDAQLEVGQYLLWKAEADDDEVIACSGVAWLLRAAKYGNPEATCLLRQCLREGRGITAEKRAEMVKLCDEDHFAILVKHAARHLFRSISSESPTTTPAQLIEAIGSKHDSRPGLLLKDDERALLIQLLKSYEGKELVEEDFMLLMQGFAEGRPPSKLATSADAKTSPIHNEDFSFIELLSQAWHSAKDLFGHALRVGESAGSHSLSAIFPTQQLISLIALAGFSHISVSSLFLALPLFVCYLTFSTMLSFTLQLHQTRPEWQAYSVWNDLLRRFVPDLCSLETEARFARRSLPSCLTAIAAGIVAALCLPLANEAWLPRTPLGLVAAISAYIALKSGRAGPDALQVLATITAATVFQALGSLPSTWAGVRILSLLGCPIGTLPLGKITLSLGLPAALHVRLLWLLFRNAYRDDWKGLKTALPPLLLVTVWARLSACLLLSSPPSSLLSWLVGPPLLVLSLPILAISWLFSFTQAVVTMEGVIVLLTLGLVGAALCRPRSWILLAHLVHGLAELSHNPLLRLGAIWAAVITMAVYLYGDWVLDKAPASSLSWQTYSRLCGPTAWRNTNMAHTQILCSHLQGHKVTWLGRFKYVRITETENGVESLASMLPQALSSHLECLFGDSYPACTNMSPESIPRSPFYFSKSPPKLTDLGFSGWLSDKEICLVVPFMQQKCHLKRYDRHKFEVTVGMPKGSQRFRKNPKDLRRRRRSSRRRLSLAQEDSKDMVLRAGHEFGAWLFSLRRGTILEFSTVLEGRLGSKHPTFELRSGRTSNAGCHAPSSKNRGPRDGDWRQDGQAALSFMLKLLLGPFLSLF
uniref:wolframin-like isoform X2 n=1 Tax=Myxine glutinosa TaxID=7769 RepID=UPI00358ECF27